MSPKLLKAADHLLQLKLISPGHHENVKRIAEGTQERSEEVIIVNSVMSEADLLKAMAGVYRTKFASTDKLAKADIPLATMEMIPFKVSEMFQIFPVLFDPKTQIISVVTADPDEKDLMREVQLVAGATSVQAFFARPAAIKALIQKHHAKDPRAFEVFERARAAAQSHGERTLQSDGRAIPKGPVAISLGDDDRRSPQPGFAPALQQGQRPATAIPAPPASKLAFLDLEPPPPPTGMGAQAPLRSPQEQPTLARPAAQRAPAADLPPMRAPSISVSEPTLSESAFELANVLVNLIESGRPELRGHSGAAARLMRRMCERIGLDAETTLAYVFAAQFHDLGKAGQYHLTPLNVAEYEGHKIAVEKLIETPNRLLESARLPAATREALSQMYERFAGGGIPSGVSGKDISLGARLLAVCDVYTDLTQNPRNPKRKQLDPAEACVALAESKGKIFDPSLVELLKSLVGGEDVRQRLLSARRRTLVLDADPEESLVLELRLIEAGFEVRVARSLDAARKIAETGSVDLVVSDLNFPDGSGLSLLQDARKTEWGKDLPWVIYAVSKNRGEAQKAFDLGVLDFIAKPAPTDVVLAKLRSLVDNRPKGTGRGVSGSLQEMSLGDVIQILSQGRKTGRLELRTRLEVGEIFFIDGEIAHAKFRSQTGVEPFFKMMLLKEGDFSFDTGATLLEKRSIHESSESLLLEALRRIDEGIR
jgi:response regulator RpfG family c-di-GMP phosphodiesterase